MIDKFIEVTVIIFLTYELFSKKSLQTDVNETR